MRKRTAGRIERTKVSMYRYLMSDPSRLNKVKGKRRMEMIALRNEGMTLEEIGDRYKLSVKAVIRIINGAI